MGWSDDVEMGAQFLPRYVRRVLRIVAALGLTLWLTFPTNPVTAPMRHVGCSWLDDKASSIQHRTDRLLRAISPPTPTTEPPPSPVDGIPGC
jgi:hypothetical protein